MVSPSGYVDAYTGQWLDSAYGTSVMLEFQVDGRYQQTLLIKTSAYACKTQVFIYNEGTAVIDGMTIKTFPTKGRVKALDSCVARNNFDRDDDIARKQGTRYTWRFGPNASNPNDSTTYLILGLGADNVPAYFRSAP